MNLTPRDEDDEVFVYINPFTELNVGLWLLFLGASAFLALRIWVKMHWRYGLWYDDYILLVSWMILLANNSIIVHEFATGYVLRDSTEKWDDRMHILINISSCGTLIGQALTKTAFAVTLLRMSNQWQRYVLWFCIATMNTYMIVKVIFQWAKVCDSKSYDVWYRLDFCLEKKLREDFKEVGNIWNIVMDFVFATFPWLMTRRLEMRRAEKIGLCITMSLGVIVAVVAAVRVAWKDNGNRRDEWYIWRNGVSQVWYSSEVAGTILVQCIPVLRPILRDIHTSLTATKLGSSTTDRQSTILTKRLSSRRSSVGPRSPVEGMFPNTPDKIIELNTIPEEGTHSWLQSPGSSSEDDVRRIQAQPSPKMDDDWPIRDTGGSQGSDMRYEPDRTSRSTVSFDLEQGQHGLSAPPRRLAR